jgi:hypothetical protein
MLGGSSFGTSAAVQTANTHRPVYSRLSSPTVVAASASGTIEVPVIVYGAETQPPAPDWHVLDSHGHGLHLGFEICLGFAVTWAGYRAAQPVARFVVAAHDECAVWRASRFRL